jgi:hypothetical protein
VAKQINPALARLWITEKNRQYGYRKSVLLESVTEEQNRILDFLELGITSAQYQSLSQIARADKSVTEELLTRLNPLIWSSNQKLSDRDVSERFAEITRILLQGGDPAEVLAGRRRQVVFLEKLDITGLTIAKALTLAGVGKLISFDQKRITEKDVGPLAYDLGELGLPRVRAAQKLLGRHLEFHSRISESIDRVSISVILSSDITPPKSYQRWMARDVPHLAICFDEEGVEISQLVIPGETACLGCVQLRELETKPNWPVIAPQLLSLDRDLADCSLSLFAAGVVTNSILNFLDSQSPLASATRLERTGELRSFVPEESSCGCRFR